MTTATIKIKRTGTSGLVPTANQLAVGELMLNYFDGILYYLDANSSIGSIGTSGGGGGTSDENAFGQANASFTAANTAQARADAAISRANGAFTAANSTLTITTRTVSTTANTLVASDHQNIVLTSNNSNVTIIVPANMRADFSTVIIQGGNGYVYIVAGAGAAINSYTNLANTAGKNAAASVIGYAANTFNLSGTLVT